jgi:hypothetical protein
MIDTPAEQYEMHAGPHGRIMAMDSAYYADARNRGTDVVVNASYCGVLPARFIAESRPRGVVSIDCGIGPEGAAIAGLWYLEALNIPAVTADAMTVFLSDGRDLYERGIVSRVNRPAHDCGVRPGMTTREAALIMLEKVPDRPAAAEVTNRTVVEQGPDGRCVVCTDSIAFGLPEDARNVLVTAGITGKSALPYMRVTKPFGMICSDGGMGRENSGVWALDQIVVDNIAGAAVDARGARMGDGLSTYHDGIISAANSLARAAGVTIGMPAKAAATLLLNRR